MDLQFLVIITFIYILAWKECIDEQTGYPYYWNVNTDEVTWEAPQELQHLTEKSKTQNKSKSLYVPPQTAPTISSATLPKDSIKIYKIQSDTDKSKRDKPKSTQKHSHQNKKPTKKYVSSLSDSEDEYVVFFFSFLVQFYFACSFFRKIVLISSYGSDSESEDDSNVVAQKGAVVKVQCYTIITSFLTKYLYIMCIVHPTNVIG